MKCYVVIEEDRGTGISVENVYISEKTAEEQASKSSHTFVQESEIVDLPHGSTFQNGTKDIDYGIFKEEQNG